MKKKMFLSSRLFFIIKTKNKTNVTFEGENRWIIANSTNDRRVSGTWLRATRPGRTPKVKAQNCSSADTSPAWPSTDLATYIHDTTSPGQCPPPLPQSPNDAPRFNDRP